MRRDGNSRQIPAVILLRLDSGMTGVSIAERCRNAEIHSKSAFFNSCQNPKHSPDRVERSLTASGLQERIYRAGAVLCACPLRAPLSARVALKYPGESPSVIRRSQLGAQL